VADATRVRLKAAHVPRGVGFATKPKNARRINAGAIVGKVLVFFVAGPIAEHYDEKTSIGCVNKFLQAD
jgi:hypothetical protein